MKIDDDQMYHGAALIQVAEQPGFTAINELAINGESHRGAYRVNDGIGLYIKYATSPNGIEEYLFNFTESHVGRLAAIDSVTDSLFLALVCVKDREICCLGYDQFSELVERRRDALGGDEEQYSILVTARTNKSLRVYVNKSGTKNTILGDAVVIKRRDFPRRLFE
jgi:hypothetical protein|tara:strand:+ start:261 stop:758 length:498 start_codon:yes stop_codon:yes gene_type:complete